MPGDTPPPSSAPNPAQDLGFDWPHALLLTATGAAVVIVAGSLLSLRYGRGDRTALFLAMFMACFSVFKLMVAVRALREVRLVPRGGIDPREHFGTPARFHAWVAVKIVVAVLAMGAAAVILVHGPGSLR